MTNIKILGMINNMRYIKGDKIFLQYINEVNDILTSTRNEDRRLSMITDLTKIYEEI